MCNMRVFLLRMFTVSVCLTTFVRSWLQAEAQYEFNAEPGSTELTIHVGDVLTVTNQVCTYVCGIYVHTLT